MLCLIKLAASTTTQGRNQCSLDLKHVPTCKYSCLGASVGSGSHSQTHALQPSENAALDKPCHHSPQGAQQSWPPPQGLPFPSPKTWGVSECLWVHSTRPEGLWSPLILNRVIIIGGLSALQFSPL